MKESPKRLVNVLLFLTLMQLLGCATTEFLGDKGLLDFIQNGHTTKHDVFLALGQPSGFYEADSVYTYRIAGDSNKGYQVVGRDVFGWQHVKYSLVFIFNDEGILEKHSMVPVN